MLASRRTLGDPLTGRPIDLPMLVPAFTSKGFPMSRQNGKDRSSIAGVLEGTRTCIRESLLVSAYDIHHGYVPKPDRYFGGKVLAFLDSGGYELAATWDSTEPKQGRSSSRVFREKEYRQGEAGGEQEGQKNTGRHQKPGPGPATQSGSL